MPRQILTLELDGLTAGDYLAHIRDPEPAALDAGLRTVVVRAETLGATIEAVLTWDGPAPSPRVAAQIAGLPLVAEVARIEATDVHDLPVDRPAAQPASVHPKPGRLSALTERAAARLAAQARPATFQPLPLRWA